MPRAAWGAAIAHAGLGVMILGLAGMGLATDRLVLLHPGESADLAGNTYTLRRIEDVNGANFTARQAIIEVSRQGQPRVVLAPQKRNFPLARMTTSEAAIHTTWLADLYAVLGEEREGGAVLRLHHNPLAPWIWLGAAIMALGSALSLSDRRMRISAPVRKLAKEAVRA